MKIKSSILLVPTVLGAMNVAPIVGHADDKDIDKTTMQQEQGQSMSDLQSKLTQSIRPSATTGSTYTADKDTSHAKIIGTPVLTSDTGQKVGSTYTTDNTAFDLGIEFNYEFNNLKEGDTIIIPYTTDFPSVSTGNNHLFAQNNVTKGAIKGAGSDDRGMIFKVVKDAPGQSTGTIKLGARIGNARAVFPLKMNADGNSMSYQSIHLKYNGKLVSTVNTTAKDTTGNMFYANGYKTSSPVTGVGNQVGIGNLVAYDSYTTGKHLPTTPMYQTAEATVKNDTFIGTTNGTFNVWFYAYNKEANKVFTVANFSNNGKTYAGIHRVSDAYKQGIKYLDLPAGLTLDQVKAEAAKYTGVVNAKSISKDGHKLTTVLYISNPAKYAPKLKDTQLYQELGATSGVDFFEKAAGIKYTGDAATKVNDMMDKYAGNVSDYMYGTLANGAIDHDVDTVTSITTPEGTTTESNTTHINSSSMMSQGQSQVQAQYVDKNGKDIAAAGDPVIGWPNGSKNNPTGANKATVQSKVIKGNVLTSKPTGAKTTAPYAVTADFPAEGQTTLEKYVYTPIAKFVTDEASAKDKMPGYVNDDKDAAKIKQSYTIPYVKGKKAQGPDGKDLKLVNANDRTKGYVAPAVKDATKDTKISYVADEVKMTVNYIDKVEDNKVVATDVENAINGEASTYSTDKEIKALAAKGYGLNKDNYPKGHIHNGNETFTVIVDHTSTKHRPEDPKGMDPDKLIKSVTETVNYWKQTSDIQNKNNDTASADKSSEDKSAQSTVSDGVSGKTDTSDDKKHEGLEKIKGKEFDSKVQHANFTKTIVTDNVTNKVINETAWTSKNNNFNAVESPKLDGYTADQLKVAEVKDVKPTDKNIDKDVIYKAGEQKGKVTYIDDSESDASKKIIKEDGLTGKSDQKLDYSTKESIDKIEADGYKLKEDKFPKGGVTLDHDDKTDQNYEVHFDKTEKELSHTGSTNIVGQVINKIVNIFK
ncbi:hypothetical protein IV73_GL001080 [Weissella kandleri]|uniref:MucBP domain-containing protein n=1 Tax=Weissella kandleri TaxID=1616 RepID=A0A0R2JBY0_9LACO|nr:hypothetical protein [Weissella kandleri]KRN74803.1 hypothetical protein IV73_GL001080 [Weissella kandleri]